MSLTNEIVKKMVLMLNEKDSGMSLQEIWDKLEEDKEFSKQLYNSRGERRNGLLTGITSRIRLGKIDGIKILSDETGRLLFISSSNNLEYADALTTKYLYEMKKIELIVKDYEFSKSEQSTINSFKKGMNQLENSQKKLAEVIVKIEENCQ